MKLPRFVGVVDLAVLFVVTAWLLLPPRPMQARDAMKGTDADRFALAHAEAKLLADPTNGAKIADLSERLGNAGFRDWAIEAAVEGSERAKSSPNRWRALMAASVAYVDRLDVHPALDYIDQAIAECVGHRDACPKWEEIRMGLYRQHLDAGIKSGIDPRKDPVGFRKAGESGMRPVRITPTRPQK
jgi:hypothetical protein